jgi:hypothetical protein
MKRLGLLVALTTILSCAGSGGDGSNTAFDATKYAGAYHGTWNNATFNSTGASRLTITVNAANKSGSVEWDMDGNVLGQSNPPAETFNGTYNADGFTFGGTSATFGTFQIVLDKDGRATGSATNIPNAAISRVDFNGNATETAINLSYVVTFSAAGGGGTATGSVSMTKQ